MQLCLLLPPGRLLLMSGAPLHSVSSLVAWWPQKSLISIQMVCIQPQLYHRLLAGVSLKCFTDDVRFLKYLFSFTQPIPIGTKIPHYAYLDVEVRFFLPVLTQPFIESVDG